MGYDIFPTSDFVEFKATFEDTDYYPGMDWGGAHHSVGNYFRMDKK